MGGIFVEDADQDSFRDHVFDHRHHLYAVEKLREKFLAILDSHESDTSIG